MSRKVDIVRALSLAMRSPQGTSMLKQAAELMYCRRGLRSVRNPVANKYVKLDRAGASFDNSDAIGASDVSSILFRFIKEKDPEEKTRLAQQLSEARAAAEKKPVVFGKSPGDRKPTYDEWLADNPDFKFASLRRKTGGLFSAIGSVATALNPNNWFRSTDVPVYYDNKGDMHINPRASGGQLRKSLPDYIETESNRKARRVANEAMNIIAQKDRENKALSVTKSDNEIRHGGMLTGALGAAGLGALAYALWKRHKRKKKEEEEGIDDYADTKEEDK